MMPVLPEELKETILVLACTLPSTYMHARTVSQHNIPHFQTLDIRTTICVMQLALRYYTLGAQLLYRAPCIATPSQLTQFTATLVNRPVLGLFVRHLYIGTIERGSEQPLAFLRGRLASYAQAMGLREHDTVPHGDPTTSHGSVLAPVLEIDIAETLAFFVGPDGVHGLDIYRPGFDREGEWVGMGAWVLCLHEARSYLNWFRAMAYQARLETVLSGQDTELVTLRDTASACAEYLAGYIRRLGDQYMLTPLLERRPGTRHDPLDFGDAGPVAPLPPGLPVHTNDVMQTLQARILQRWASQKCLLDVPVWLSWLAALAIAYGQVLGLECADAEAVRHSPYACDALLRDARMRGSAFFHARDTFHDPILFARSGAIRFLVGDETSERDEPAASRNEPAMWAIPEYSQDGVLLPVNGEGLLRGSFSARPSGLLPHRLVAPLPQDEQGQRAHVQNSAPPTLGSLVQCAHAIFAYVPNLQSLGLSGVLERALASMRGASSMPQLERVYLGPPPPYWAYALQFDSLAFALVKHITITGCMLLPEEAYALAGANGTLPHLKSVTWSMHHIATSHRADAILTALTILLDRQDGMRGIALLRVILHPHDYACMERIAPKRILQDPHLSLETFKP
ncbi:hypothetical protein MVES1_003657 [Malassezia vespertilionis]|uniref:uncharacterized protein n=1 Tax=Malassezia vespertilionis TaxID=2020962 RepID=UPI0024B1939C|nr:uncharacterized protein MVES1_003657 [Malassezia vespertilionis]WFD08285.1 hypothetical protein MVES1_003657 [Malassezia vespertilionis]